MDFEALKSRWQTLTGALSRGQLATLGLTFIAVVGMVAGSAMWLNTPTYSLLFSDLDAESASQVVARLEADQIPYRLSDGGRAVRVPQEQVDRLKIQLAASVTSGRIGFEIFDRTAFGQTEFLEQINYRRALEGELARTISTIAEVASARVHLAMAKDSLFGAREQSAKASVILRLKNNRPLSTASVQGITSLVAASVEGLRPESVVIIDNYGRSLAENPHGDTDRLDAEAVERQQKVERDLTQKVVALLEPVVGVGHVRVNVSARLNNDTQEQTEELYDPNAVIRSRNISTESAPGLQAQGVAGSRGNLPQPVAPAQNPAVNTVATAGPAAATGLASRSTETTNFEISKVTRVTSKPRGAVARLSVGVLLDNETVVTKNADGTTTKSTKPREPADIQKIQELVTAGVGLDTERGDRLTVENIAFSEVVDEETPATLVERFGPIGLEALKVVAVLVIGVLAFMVFVRPIVKQTTSALTVRTPAMAGAAAGGGANSGMGGGGGGGQGTGHAELPKTIEDLEGEIEAQLEADAQRAQDPRTSVLTKRVQRLAQDNPENAARLISGWLADDGGGKRR